MMPILIGVICAMIVGIIPVIGGFLAAAGFFNVCLKAVRGQKPEPADAFIGLKEGLVDHIVIGLLAAIGIILCFVGIYITHPLFYNGHFFILDKKMKWGEAKDKCMAEVKPKLVAWIIFGFVVGLVAGLGSILCGIGIFFTLPIGGCAFAYAYNKLWGGGGAAPAAPAAPQA
jgi:hypothetical protein